MALPREVVRHDHHEDRASRALAQQCVWPVIRSRAAVSLPRTAGTERQTTRATGELRYAHCAIRLQCAQVLAPGFEPRARAHGSRRNARQQGSHKSIAQLWFLTLPGSRIPFTYSQESTELCNCCSELAGSTPNAGKLSELGIPSSIHCLTRMRQPPRQPMGAQIIAVHLVTASAAVAVTRKRTSDSSPSRSTRAVLQMRGAFKNGLPAPLILNVKGILA